jgi:hypothetical protein
LLAGGLDLEEVAPLHKVGWYPQILLAQMDEQRYCSNVVRNEVYQLQLVVVQETSKEVVSGHIEPTLEEGGEDDRSLSSSVGNASPVGAFHSISALDLSSPCYTSAWIFSSFIKEGFQTVYEG